MPGDPLSADTARPPTTTSPAPSSSPRPTSPAALPLRASPVPSPAAANGNGNGNGSSPAWARPGLASPMAARRLSSRPYSIHSLSSQQQNPALAKRAVRFASIFVQKSTALFMRLTPLQRALAIVAALTLTALSILGLVYSHAFFEFLVPIAQSWRAMPFGWAVLWLATFVTAFPPMIGYSSAVSMGGFIFGFPWGWPIVATASVAGSFVALLTSRGIFSGYVHRLVGEDKRFVALAQVLHHDGLGVLTMIRLCPLPFSLSNGFLATIPSIRPWAFALATALASPKLLVHVFIGSRLAYIIEEGDKLSTRDVIVNYASMIGGGLLGVGVGLFIWRRTMARAAELAAEEAAEIGAAAGGTDDDYTEDDGFAYDSEQTRLVNGTATRAPNGAAAADADVDAAELMDDDDISLWENDGAQDWGYRDSLSTGDEEAAIQGKDAPAHSNGNGK